MGASYNESPSDRSATAEPREVRRYPNRRMYDTRERCYVALDEIGRWIDEGQHVRVIDVKTNEEVTSAALLPLLAERLARDLQGAEGAETIHRWLREGVSTSAPLKQHSTIAAEHALNPPSMERRLADLEARVRVLEACSSAAASTTATNSQ